MDEKEYLYRGWDFAAKLAGTEFASDQAASYVAEVEAAIKDLEEGIRNLKGNQTDASLGGFFAVKAMLQIKDLLMKSDELKTSAKNNSEKDFEFTFYDDIDKALIEGLEQN